MTTMTKEKTKGKVKQGYRLVLGKVDFQENGRRDCQAELTWTFDGEEFSMSGAVWNPRHSDTHVGGQCVEQVAELAFFHPLAQRMCQIWKKWHLNGMKPGCAHQRALGWDQLPIDHMKPLSTYGKHFHGQKQPSWNMLAWITPKEHPRGLLGKACPECGYKYGTAWLRETIPAEVKAEIWSWGNVEGVERI
jgi:hypothetical protein